MLVNLLFLLLGAGLISEFVPKNRLPILWSLFATTAVGYFIYMLTLLGPTPDLHINYPWLKIPNLAINLEIVLDSYNIHLVFALAMLALLVLLQNTFGNDKAKNSLNGLVLFNLLSALMLVFASNYIQVLVAIGVCDVLVFSAINNTEAKKNYIYTNFLADIGLLSIFAVVLGQGGGLDLKNLADYAQFGHHKDFVAIILLLCIFIKTGLFPFHGSYINMRQIGFNRLNYVLYAATPLTGYLLLLKTEALLQISHYSYPLLQIISVLSILWGALGAVAIDNLKQKAVYFALMFWGMVYAFAAFHGRLSAFDFASLLTASFLFSQILMLIYTICSNETYVSETGGLGAKIKFTCALTVWVLSSYFAVLLTLFKQNIWLSGVYLIIFALASAHVLSQILLGQSKADERVQAMVKNPSILMWFPIALTATAIIFHFKPSTFALLGCIFAWVGIFVYRPLRKFDKLYENDDLQDADYVSSMYDLLLVTPINVIGRLLWVTIDFVFVEKKIISSVQSALNFMIFVFRRIHSGTLLGALVFMALGIIAMVIAWWYGSR